MEMSLFLQFAFLILEIGTLLIICLPIVFLILKIRMIYHDSKVLEISMTNTEKWILQYIQRRPKIIPAFYRKLQAIKLRKSKYSRIFNIEYLEGLCLFFIYIHILSLFSVLVFLYMAKNIDFKIYEILVKRMIFMHTFVYFVFYFYVVNHDLKILEMSHSECIELICHYYSFYSKKIIPAFYRKQLRLVRIYKFFETIYNILTNLTLNNFLNSYRYIPIRIAYVLENFFRDKQYDRECPICVEICESKVTACGHCFCHSCLFNINMKNCPICRETIDASQIISLCDAAKTGRHVYT